MPPTLLDRREEFAAYFCRAMRMHPADGDALRSCRQWLRLSGACDDAVRPQPSATKGRPVVVIPGMFGECVAPWVTPFSDAYQVLRERGHRIHVINVEGRSSSARNGRIIDAWMRSHADGLEGAIVVAYSKGATDFLHAAALATGGQGWLSQVAALVTVSGVINGTPLATAWADRFEDLLSGIDVPTCGAGDGQAVDSQTRIEAGAACAAYLAIDGRPRAYALVAVAGEATVNPLLEPFFEQLARIDARNDGQVLVDDAALPGSELLAIADADHWSIALPFESSGAAMRLLSRNNHFPRLPLLVALLDYIADQPVTRD